MSTELTLVGGSSRHHAYDDEATRVDLLDPRFGSDDEATLCDSPWAHEGRDESPVSRVPLPALRTTPVESSVRPVVSSTPRIRAQIANLNDVDVVDVAQAPAVVRTAKRPLERRLPPRALVSLRCELPAAFFGDEAAERRARRAGGGWLGAVIVAAAATFGVAALHRAHDRPAPTMTRTIEVPEAAEPAVAGPTALPPPQDDTAPLELAKRHRPRSTSAKPSRAPRRLPLPPAPDSDPT